MLRALTPGERTIGELGAPFEMTFAAASKHVKVLEGAGLVERRILGRSHFCRLQPARSLQPTPGCIFTSAIGPIVSTGSSSTSLLTETHRNETF